jgi:ATP-dependent helicase YprA (DUF1998 family)
MLPRNSKSKNIGTKLGHLATKVWTALKPNDLKDIAQKVKEKFKWDHEPRPFQLDAIVAQLKREDVSIHAGTGSGKTAVAAGPHAHEKMKGKVTFMLSPLIALQNEQVSKTTGNHYDAQFLIPCRSRYFAMSSTWRLLQLIVRKRAARKKSWP